MKMVLASWLFSYRLRSYFRRSKKVSVYLIGVAVRYLEDVDDWYLAAIVAS
jgi:predicted DNA-binding protein